MTRVKRSVNARKKRRAVLERAKGYRGEKRTSYRRAKEQVMKSDAYAYRDRRNRKRDFRSLWIVRINAAARREGLTYSRLMAGLREGGVEVNRKMLADVAVRDPETRSGDLPSEPSRPWRCPRPDPERQRTRRSPRAATGRSTAFFSSFP